MGSPTRLLLLAEELILRIIVTLSVRTGDLPAEEYVIRESQGVRDLHAAAVVDVDGVVTWHVVPEEELSENREDIRDIARTVACRIATSEGVRHSVNAVIFLVADRLETVQTPLDETLDERIALFLGAISLETLGLDAGCSLGAIEVTRVRRIDAIAVLRDTLGLELGGSGSTVVRIATPSLALFLDLGRRQSATLGTGDRIRVRATVGADTARQEVRRYSTTLALRVPSAANRIATRLDTIPDIVLEPLETARVNVAGPVSTTGLTGFSVVHATVQAATEHMMRLYTTIVFGPAFFDTLGEEPASHVGTAIPTRRHGLVVAPLKTVLHKEP